MYHMHQLATAIQADREREFRNRRPRTPGIPSGRRHPAAAEIDRLERLRGRQPLRAPGLAGSR